MNHKHHRFLAILVATTSLFLAFVATTAMVHGQTETTQQGDPGAQDTSESTADSATNDQETEEKPARPKQEALKNLLMQIRTDNQEINELFGSMPIGFPKIQKEHMTKIAALREKIAEQQGNIRQLALDAYLEAPEESPFVKSALLVVLSNCLDPKDPTQRFDPKKALEIANALIRNGNNQPTVFFAAMKASFAVHDFDRARTMFEEISKLSPQPLPEIQRRLEEMESNWARELEIRRMEAATDDLPRALIETSEGNIVVELFENHAPQTVGNFVSLAEQGYYNNNTFFYVKPGGAAQAGCPKGNGTSDPGYKIPCECYKDEIRHHFAGTLSMFNNGKDTGGSVFFISMKPSLEYDGKFTVFGRVVENMDAVYRLKTVDNRLGQDAATPSQINKVTILRKRDHEYAPTRATENMENELLKQLQGGDGNPGGGNPD